MPHHVFFMFSSGLEKPIRAPAGTKGAIARHVEYVERTLNLTRTQYEDNPWHWDHRLDKAWANISDDALCNAVTVHNRWVRGLYLKFDEWAKDPVVGGDTITPEDAKGFWGALRILSVPMERWSEQYYFERMEYVYSVLRGHECAGTEMRAEALTAEQARDVIWLFSQWLDRWDSDIEVPLGCDHIASSKDGGYIWCDNCGAVTEDHVAECEDPKCPARRDMGWDDDDDDDDALSPDGSYGTKYTFNDDVPATPPAGPRPDEDEDPGSWDDYDGVPHSMN